MEPPALKDELKSATTMSGVLSAMMFGLLRMPMWLVDNLDLKTQVYINVAICNNNQDILRHCTDLIAFIYMHMQ